MTSNPQMPSEAKPEIKSPSFPAGLTGKGYASGLLMTGVVIVGSWMGMAAYVDYRLQDVEKHLAGNREEIVAQVNQETQKTRDALVLRVNETSSVLAKGILEITETTNNGFENTKESLTAYQESLNQSQQSSAEALKKDIEASKQAVIETISSSQNDLSKSLASQWNRAQDVQSQTLQTALTDIKTTQTDSTGQILGAVHEVGSDVKNAKNAIGESINTSLESLQDLVKNGNLNQREQFDQLLTNLGGINEQTSGTSETIGNQLQGLADQVAVLHQNLKSSQGSLDEIQAFMPEIRKTYEAQLAEWRKQSDQSVSSLTTKITELHSQIDDMSNGLKTASETMMNALYVNSQGLEGTRVDLKSDLVLSREETSAQLQDLSQSLQAISSDLKTLQSKVSDENTKIGLNPNAQKHTEALKTAMTEFSNTLGGVRETLTTALLPGLEKLEQSSENANVQESVQLLKKAVEEVDILISSTEQQRSSLELNKSKNGAIAMDDATLNENSPPAKPHSANDQTEAVKEHPEHRTEQALGFRLY